MKTLENEMVVAFDVDDTLLMWEDHTQPGEGKIAVVDPYDNSVAYLYPHTRHIDLVRKWKGRGFSVIVWSAGGVQWAKAAIAALKLEAYVDLVLTKPSKHVDDLPPKDIIGTPVYIPYERDTDA